ncbi:MAG: hypothetical protein EZS28_036776 [Streblomastix strix]|uniref:Uncharacterized protein n=1 Tax=Streblomastix strix TaxID=222440 RepID=A0A5J4UB63_9EUKA|nr:MAG: hypothetical protein EZS28_036776 [Streblomastix strix]
MSLTLQVFAYSFSDSAFVDKKKVSGGLQPGFTLLSMAAFGMFVGFILIRPDTGLSLRFVIEGTAQIKQKSVKQ